MLQKGKKYSKTIFAKMESGFCGNFIFVTSSYNKTKLKDFLGKDYENINNISYKINKK